MLLFSTVNVIAKCEHTDTKKINHNPYYPHLHGSLVLCLVKFF